MADLISSLTLTTLRFVLRHLPDVPIRDIDDPCHDQQITFMV
jgi:hypothetical protein